jgi:hypothetical protein
MNHASDRAGLLKISASAIPSTGLRAGQKSAMKGGLGNAMGMANPATVHRADQTLGVRAASPRPYRIFHHDSRLWRIRLR